MNDARLRFFRDLSGSERLRIFIALGVVPEGSDRQMTLGVEDKLMDWLILKGKFPKVIAMMNEAMTSRKHLSDVIAHLPTHPVSPWEGEAVFLHKQLPTSPFPLFALAKHFGLDLSLVYRMADMYKKWEQRSENPLPLEPLAQFLELGLPKPVAEYVTSFITTHIHQFLELGSQVA